jgi:glycosyltransferase involved in cell wall biosynthesis
MNKKYRIAMVAACPFPANRGTPSRILQMSESLAELGYDVHVVTYHIGINMKTKGIKIHRIPNIPTYSKLSSGPAFQKPFLDFLLFLELLKVVKNEKIDLIHGHHYEGGFVSLMVRKLTGIPVIYDAHANLVEEMVQFKFLSSNKFSRYFWKKIGDFVPKSSNYVVAVSEELKEIIIKQGIIPDNIAVIPTGVNPEIFEKGNRSLVRKELGIIDSPIIMYTGNLSPFQGIDNLIKSMPLVLDSINNAKLIIVGGPNEDLQKYKVMVDKLGISKNIIFTGERPFEDLPDILSAADVVVSPRTSCAGIPQKLSNYMAAGKAIVCFKGSAKTLKNGYNGIVIDNDDVSGFAKEIIELLEKPELAKQLGINAKKSITGNLDWRYLVLRIDNIYQKILNDTKIRNITM